VHGPFSTPALQICMPPRRAGGTAQSSGTPGRLDSEVDDGTVLAGAPPAPGTGGDASDAPPWLSALHASFQQQLSDGLASSEAAAHKRLEAQAAQQKWTLEDFVEQLRAQQTATSKAVDAGSDSAVADLAIVREQLRQQGLALQALHGVSAASPEVTNAALPPEQSGNNMSVAGSITSGTSTVQKIETVLATALGEQDASLQWDVLVCYFSTELCRITQALVRDKKLDDSEGQQLNTMVGAARMLLHLRTAHSAAMSEDDLGALDDILEHCSRDVCRIHVWFDPLVKSKEDAEKIFSAAVSKRDKDTSIEKLGGSLSPSPRCKRSSHA
jgi:hypothetical protein